MTSYAVELFEYDLVWLAYSAGVAQGSGNTEAAAALTAILQRVQRFEGDPEVETINLDENDYEPERTVDPNFAPPMSAPPMNPDGNFGAGPAPVL